MKTSTKSFFLMGTIACVLMAQAGVAQYQQGAQGADSAAQPQAAPPPSAENISDEQLEQFVQASAEVQSIQQTYTVTISEAENQEEARSLQIEAQEEMIGALEDAGLTVEDYNQIASAVQSNEQLRSRVEQMQ